MEMNHCCMNKSMPACTVCPYLSEMDRRVRPESSNAVQGAIRGAGAAIHGLNPRGEQNLADVWAEQKKLADPWADRKSGMRCRTCVWWVSKEPSGPTKPDVRIVGRCRRHAPTMNGFPVAYQTDWCGDHRVDENKV